MAQMKRFTPNDIAESIKRRFLRKENLRGSVDDGTVDSMIRAVSETFAEGIRYDEYLTRENVWEHLRNLSTGIGMSSLVGYQANRKRGAVTNLLFTVDGNVRRFGAFAEEVWVEELDDDGNVIALRQEPGVVDYHNLRSLRHYPGVGTNPEIEIPIHTVLQDNDSEIQFITLESRSIRYAGDFEADQDHRRNETSRWARIPCIQGRRRSFVQSGVRGREFERVTINSRNVDNMSEPYSEDFLIVRVRVPGSDEFEEWERVSNVRLAGPYDRVFMVETERDYSRVHIVFGNGISGRRVPRGTDVEVSYLETRGSEGNIDESQRITEFRTNIEQIYAGVPLYVTNLTPITSGTDEDTLADIKAAAPQHYLTVESVGSEEAYVAAIESLPDVRRARVFRGIYRRNQADTERDTVSFTAIAEDGTAPQEMDIIHRVRLQLGRKTSPTDILQYDPPDRIGVAYNVQGYIDDITQPLQTFVNEVRRLIYQRYRIREMDFKESIFHIDVLTLLRNNIDALEAARAFPEAVITEEFYRDMFLLGDEGSLRRDFAFNSSLAPFREIKNDVEYVLRVDFVVPYTPIRHRSRTVLLIPNPEEDPPEGEEYIIRQFDLLENIVMTPERTRSILNDTFGIYGEKTETVWHWINRKDLEVGDPAEDDPEDFDVYWDDQTSTLEVVEPLQSMLQAVPSRNYRISYTLNEAEDDIDSARLYYTEVVDLDAMTEDQLRNYFETHRDWKETEWAQDPDASAAFISHEYFGDIPTMYVPDGTHRAPIELTFRPTGAEDAVQVGTGSIYINPEFEGRSVEFIPSTEYRGSTEEGELVENEIKILATPRSLDLMIDQEFGIFNLRQEDIKVDLRYRTDADEEFQTAFEDELMDIED